MTQQIADIQHPGFIQRFDSVPAFWQHLRGLNQDDLVAELIQNELDANATHTTILFGANTMICLGNGDPVDKDGWERLTYVSGAGDRVPRKRKRIGIKNHGIKTCFTIGDDINIRSDGKMVRQTLYENSIDKPASPATYPHWVQDNTAPATGCLIEVPYRVKPLLIDSGEPIRFEPTTDIHIKEIFIKACHEAPQRFIGSLRPDIRKDYVLELKHHELGTACFEFSCGRVRAIHRLNFYNRMCCTSGEVPELPEKVVESCCLFRVPIPKDSNREIPDFYSSPGRFFLSEISWKTEGGNRPVAIHGHRRYPIEYGSTDDFAHTGLGLNFSAPYISDLERRGAVEADTFNECIENACKSVLVKILRFNLIPRHGARAMNLLVDPEGVNEATLRNMVELMLDAGAFPILRHKPMIQRDKKRSRNKKSRTAVRFGPSKTADGHLRPIVLPMFSWEEDKISPILSKLCPPGEDQIDPSVPGPILRLLEEIDNDRFNEHWDTFDEEDVVQRLQPKLEIAYFPWSNDDEWEKQLGNPSVIQYYLDVLMAIYENKPDSIKLGELLENVYLPDSKSVVTPVHKLYSGLNIPPGLPFEDIPPILHPQISGHRIFRKAGWKRQRFTFKEFLKQANLNDAGEGQRKLFWDWFRNNWRLIKEKPDNPWPILVDLPIWPDHSRKLLTLAELCKPRRKNITAILAESINAPHAEVLKIGSIRRAKRGTLRIRSIPTESEILDFLDRNLSSFPRDGPLSEDEQVHFHSLESDITELASDRVIRSYLRNTTENTVALSKSGYIRPVKELIQINSDSKELHLVEDDVIDRKPSMLDRTGSWKPRTFPSSDQVLRALEQDPNRYEALPRRLRAYLQAVKYEHSENAKQDIMIVECIPDGGKLYAPGNLAFKSSRADYWGNWKHRISGQGLSADIQQVYRDVGVLGTEPSPGISLEFFKWLNGQGQSTLTRHLPCVIRHINHNRGPMLWSEEYPNIPFIPLEANDKHISLASRTSASSQNSMIFIPDFDALAEAIKEDQGNRRIQLIVLSHPSVSAPITQYMQRLGVKSLQDFARNPVMVQTQDPVNAPARLFEELEVLRGRRMSKELRKRLASTGLPLGTYRIRNNWRERMLQIKNMNVVNSLTATFKIGRYRYTISTDAALDESSNTIWFINSVDDLDALFYRTIAERIFENPSEFLSIILKDAVRKGFREKSVYSGPTGQPGEENGEEGDEGNEEEEGEDTGTASEGTERTHRGGYPDPGKNLPEPGKLPTDITGSGRYHRDRGKGNGGGRKSPKIEEIQVEDLKKNHYAWHCQICLTERTVEQLAPANSYVEIQENRIWIIKAHHVDQVNAGGARHAGNILILCNHHHQYLGDRMCRQDVIKALETASDNTVVFKTFIHGTTVARSVPGKIAIITIPLEGEKIKCFFTEGHAEYWLQKAT